jgi:exodeoxyribonuclease VII small subunit
MVQQRLQFKRFTQKIVTDKWRIIMARKDQGLKYEEAINRLQEIVQLLEQGDQTLNESLKLFEEGVGLSRLCAKRLDEAQGTIEKLIEVPGGAIVTEPVELESLGR